MGVSSLTPAPKPVDGDERSNRRRRAVKGDAEWVSRILVVAQ